MNSITLIIIISGIIFIGLIVYIMSENTDKAVKKRLLKKRLEVIKESAFKDKDLNEETSSSFIIKSARQIAKNIADKSKAINLQKELLSTAGLASDEEAVIKHITQKVIYAGFMLFLGVTMLAGQSDPFMKIGMLVIGPLLGFRLPDMKLKSIAKKRADEVTYTLPDALDLLSVCIEAGLGLDSALSRVAKEQSVSAPTLSYEFQRVTKDILAGIPRSDAFRNLIKRNGSTELRSFVSLLIQSDKLGTSISQSLKVYSDALRIKRRQKAEELAAKAGVKMSLPLVLFILPATFIVIMAPAAIKMVGMFMGGGMP
jgi:tight adherence protein C